MRPSFLISSIVAMEASKCTLLILLQPYYPHDLTQWIISLYPPWQRIEIPAPYGLPWYVLYAPGLLGLSVLSVYLAIAECLTLVYLFSRSEPYIAGAFVLTSALVFFWDPFDLWSYLFILLSVKWRPLLAAAVLVKIPLGAPSWVWQFILNGSFRAAGNWPHYFVIGAWWLGMAWYVSGMAARFSLTPDRVGQIIIRLVAELSLGNISNAAVDQQRLLLYPINPRRFCTC